MRRHGLQRHAPELWWWCREDAAADGWVGMPAVLWVGAVGGVMNFIYRRRLIFLNFYFPVIGHIP
jgi:hypothetical protein